MNPTSDNVKSFLESTKFNKKLTHSHKDFLDAPISEEELTSAIKALKNNKATGWDGLPIDFYKTFIGYLIQPLLSTCNNVMTKGDIPCSWSEACIAVFCKPAKDPCKVESYRPISLLNHDAKIFTSIIAQRLNKIIALSIHHDQSGFIPTRQLSDNVQKSLNLIYHCNTTNTLQLP